MLYGQHNTVVLRLGYRRTLVPPRISHTAAGGYRMTIDLLQRTLIVIYDIRLFSRERHDKKKSFPSRVGKGGELRTMKALPPLSKNFTRQHPAWIPETLQIHSHLPNTLYSRQETPAVIAHPMHSLRISFVNEATRGHYVRGSGCRDFWVSGRSR